MLLQGLILTRQPRLVMTGHLFEELLTVHLLHLEIVFCAEQTIQLLAEAMPAFRAVRNGQRA